MTQLIAEDMMVPSEPGIDIYVRNKRPAALTSLSSQRTLLFAGGIGVTPLLIMAQRL